MREVFLKPLADFTVRGGGPPALYAALTAGAVNTVQRMLLGLLSAGIQLIGRASRSFAAWEPVARPLPGVALSRDALYAVDAPRDVAAAGDEALDEGPQADRGEATRGVRGRVRSGAR